MHLVAHGQDPDERPRPCLVYLAIRADIFGGPLKISVGGIELNLYTRWFRRSRESRLQAFEQQLRDVVAKHLDDETEDERINPSFVRIVRTGEPSPSDEEPVDMQIQVFVNRGATRILTIGDRSKDLLEDIEGLVVLSDFAPLTFSVNVFMGIHHGGHSE